MHAIRPIPCLFRFISWRSAALVETTAEKHCNLLPLKETKSMGNRKVHAFLLVLLGVMLALTARVAGGVKDTFGAGGGPGSLSGDAALMSTRLEDGEAPELTVELELHRRVLGGSIGPPALNPDNARCLGPCPPRGRPYTNRAREKIYRCH
jgi:hypothetical protein